MRPGGAGLEVGEAFDSGGGWRVVCFFRGICGIGVCYRSPVFPFQVSVLGVRLFDGPLTTIRTDRMESWRGIVETLTGTYYSVPVSLGLLLLAGWALSVGVAVARGRFKEPIVRGCLMGPMVAIGIFIARSPAAEVRFIAPSVAVLMACTGIVCVKCGRWSEWAGQPLFSGHQSGRDSYKADS